MPSTFIKHIWPTRRERNESTYETFFTVENVEIFKRRKQCNNWLHYDEKVMHNIIQKIGCNPPYNWVRNEAPICNTSEQMKEMASNIVLKKDHGIKPPCKSLEFMTFQYSEIDYEGTVFDTGDDFWMSLHVPNLIFKVDCEN